MYDDAASSEQATPKYTGYTEEWEKSEELWWNQFEDECAYLRKHWDDLHRYNDCTGEDNGCPHCEAWLRELGHDKLCDGRWTITCESCEWAYLCGWYKNFVRHAE